jgi:hypothetical protein
MNGRNAYGQQWKQKRLVGEEKRGSLQRPSCHGQPYIEVYKN